MVMPETCMLQVVCFHDRLVLTDMLLQVRYTCGEGGQEAILSIKAHFLIVPCSHAQCMGLPAWPLLPAFTPLLCFITDGHRPQITT